MPRAKGVKQVAANRKAMHDYFAVSYTHLRAHET